MSDQNPSCCNLNLLILVIVGQLNIFAADSSSSQRALCSPHPCSTAPPLSSAVAFPGNARLLGEQTKDNAGKSIGFF